ncbi:hypothetical protein GCM10022419_041150 [Nonomuraea rosea]|uniref:Uncharacterized protein n=1 Tax=Nonomuraea rosea TaxID=638574 RepID=A0ABP6WTI4_9ACTN
MAGAAVGARPVPGTAQPDNANGSATAATIHVRARMTSSRTTVGDHGKEETARASKDKYRHGPRTFTCRGRGARAYAARVSFSMEPAGVHARSKTWATFTPAPTAFQSPQAPGRCWTAG